MSRRPADRRAWRALPLAILIACSLYALGFWLFGRLGPQPWAAAAERVRAGWRAGDAVAVQPWWAARLREQLGRRPLLQRRALAATDLETHRRLWLFSLPGHHEPLPAALAGERASLVQELDFDGLRLRRFRLRHQPVEVVYDFRARLHEAAVAVHTAGGRRVCDRWRDQRWICSRHDWNFVGRVIVELGAEPQEVIWAHPTEQGPISVRYPAVPGGRSLLVHTGLTPPAARTAGGAPVTLEVEAAGRPLARIVQPNQSGHFPHAIDIAALGPGPFAVTFRISAPRAGMRHFCFDAEVRR